MTTMMTTNTNMTEINITSKNNFQLYQSIIFNKYRKRQEVNPSYWFCFFYFSAYNGTFRTVIRYDNLIRKYKYKYKFIYIYIYILYMLLIKMLVLIPYLSYIITSNAESIRLNYDKMMIRNIILKQYLRLTIPLTKRLVVYKQNL